MNASANLINVTVDDLYPDPRTGRSIIFDNGNWNIGQYCPGCFAKPNPLQTYQCSWHDITFDPGRPNANSTATATFSFTGTVEVHISVNHLKTKIVRFGVESIRNTHPGNDERLRIAPPVLHRRPSLRELLARARWDRRIHIQRNIVQR